MRIMQIGNSHQDYLKLFAKRFKNKTTHADMMQAYADDYYWCSHTMTPALSRMGHETFLCVPTDQLSQRLWCQEHGVAWNEQAPMHSVMAQVEWFQPDILYIGSASIYHDALLQQLPHTAGCIVGWHATITQPYMGFTRYDLILSSHEECLLLAHHQGAQHTAIAYPGIPAELSTMFAPKKHCDVCFSGYWAESHPRRNNFLFEFAKRLPSLPIDCAYHLGFYKKGPACPNEVRQYDRGPVWGRSMFKAFAAARIILNGYATINFGPQNLSPNMRQLEGMGVGSFMLTESSDNLEAFFTEGVDLATYASVEEMIDKSMYYLQHEDERESIAAHGLASCQKYYSMDIRARAFMDTVLRVMTAHERPSLEGMWHELNALEQAKQGEQASPSYPDDKAVEAEKAQAGARRSDAEQCLRHGLELTRTLLLDNQMDKALPLLQHLEQLLPEGVKQLDLCRALRSLDTGDVASSERFLRNELAAWPENDTARSWLSFLALQKKKQGG